MIGENSLVFHSTGQPAVNSFAYSTVSLSYRILFFCFLFFVFAPGIGWCETVLEVSVQGVEGRLHDNIMARLRIDLYRQNSNLNEKEIRRLHQLAETDILSALAPYGYYSSSVDTTLTRIGTSWQATYVVEVGEPVKVSSISILVTGEGALLPELSSPETLFAINKGDILDQTLYESGKRTLIRQARSLGFLDAFYVTQEIRISRQEKEAEIELLLDTGPRYLFGKTSSEQDIITDELLMRFPDYTEGDYYSAQKLFELQRDLYRTDYFGSVVVEGGTDNSHGLYVPVTIRVEPHTNYNRYSFGVGYATDSRAHALFEWRNKLFNPKGHRTHISLLAGELESHLVMNYKVPVADPRFNTIAITGIWNREQWEDTTTNLLSAAVSYEYTTPRNQYGISLEVLDEDYRVGDTKGRSQLLMPRIQWSRVIAADIIDTENGLRASILVSGASESVASDATFIRARADGKIIVTPLTGWRFIGRGSMGVILVDSIDDIPPSLRFYAGGEKSVRGYRYRTLGPEDSSGTVVGGRFLLTGSIECERRLSEYWRVSAFYDVGNAMDNLEVDLVNGIGIGVGLALPFGQIRLSLAYPLMNEGSSQFVFLSVGADL